MDPLQLLIASTTKIVLVDDNAKSHARRNRVYQETKLLASPCRWQSSPVAVRKPGILSCPLGKQSLPASTITSLKSLVAPIQRQRTIPLDDTASIDDSDDSDCDCDIHDSYHRENVKLNHKLTKASELLSEYLRVATEELCLDYENDDATVTTASVTLASSSTCDSSLSSSSMSSGKSTKSLTSNVRKPVRQRSKEDILADVVEC